MLNIISFNVNGLASSDGRVPKKRKLFTWLKAHQCDIAFLQETHCTDSMQQILAHEWGGDSFFSNGTSDSRGVCILIRRGLDLEVKEMRKDDQGRLIFLKVVFQNKSILLGNVYCPNRDEVESILCVNDWLCAMISDNTILAGDFNLTLDPTKDRDGKQQNLVRDYCKRRSRALKETLEEFRLVDVWRKQNPDLLQFTFARGSSRSRLDYFFISENLCLPGTRTECNIMPPFLADHRAVQLKVDPIGQTRGPGYWKFNNSLLIDDKFVEEIRAFIQQALHENDTAGVSRVLLFDTVLCMTRGKIIQYASRKKREKDKRLHELEKIISANSNAGRNDCEVQCAIAERNEIIETKTKRNMLRCKVNWAAYAEKSSSYFFSLEQRKASSRAIPSLVLNHSMNTGELSNNTEQMLNECTAFYSKLYKRARRSGEEYYSFMESVEKISEAQKLECEIQITAAELTASLLSLKLNTAPGPDGWTVEFFRKFWDILSPLFLGVVNEIFDCGTFPESFASSVTTLIPKKGKDKRYIENLRPISLLPVSYKIIAKAMALRLKKVVGDVIHPDQTGFLKGRYIGENIRLIIDLMELGDYKENKGMIMQCDFLKAYDSIGWEYLNEIISAYGFGPKFRQWMMVFYPSGSLSARINVNNFLSPQFKVERGIRQGCPLSCLVWLLCMEPLLNRIRATNVIRGITLADKELKVSAYADDLTVILDGSERSLRNVIEVFHEFKAVSGLQLNMKKTTCTWIGSVGHHPPPICQDLKMQWLEEGGALEVLGVKVFADAQRTRSVNYDQKIEEIEKTMSPWIQRSLTPLGRVILVKSIMLAKFVHLFAVIENPDKAYIARLESILFKFIWGKKDKIKRGIAKKQFMQGGIAAPDIEAFANALKISWIKRWLDSKESSWKLLVNDKFNVNEKISIFQCAIGEAQIRGRRLPNFWDQTVRAWAQIQQNSAEVNDFMIQPLFLNRFLNIELSVSVRQLRTMETQGVTHVKDLYNFRSGRWLTAIEIKRKWNLDIMTCNYLLSRIPSKWRSMHRHDEPVTENVVLQSLTSAKKHTKWAYRGLVAPKLAEQCSCENKWLAEFGIGLDWRNITKHLTECTNNIELRWLQFRILHRILPTRKKLKIFKVIDNDQCVFCKEAVETDLHLLVQCPKVKAFWDHIWRVFKSCNDKYRTMSLTPRQIMICVEKDGDHDVNLFLLLAKQFIWKQSKNAHALHIPSFVASLVSFQNVQSCVYRLNGKSELFSSMWGATAKTIDRLKTSGISRTNIEMI